MIKSLMLYTMTPLSIEKMALTYSFIFLPPWSTWLR